MASLTYVNKLIQSLSETNLAISAQFIYLNTMNKSNRP